MMVNLSLSCPNSSVLDVANLSEYEEIQNLSRCPDQQTEGSMMSYRLATLWSLCFSFLILLSVLGNSVILFIVIQNQKMRTVTNIFIFNLCLADLINTTFNSTFNFVFMKNKDWVFGSSFCRVTNFMTHMSIVAAVCLMAAIAVERYMTIARPRSPHLSKKTTSVMLGMIWVVSIAVATPSLIYSTTVLYSSSSTDQPRHACLIIWPDGDPSVSLLDHCYQVLTTSITVFYHYFQITFFLVTYIIPMVGLSIIYCHLGTVLWISDRDKSEQYNNKVKDKRKVSIMFVVVLTVFGVCWLPYHAYFLYSYYNPHILSQPLTQHVFLAFFWLAMANSALNPIIFFLMDAKFRYCLRGLVCWCVILFTRNDFCEESEEEGGPRWWGGQEEDSTGSGDPVSRSLSCLGKVSPGVASCPEGDCNCPACLVTLVTRHQLVLFRRLSDPAATTQPRVYYYRINVLNESLAGKTSSDEEFSSKQEE